MDHIIDIPEYRNTVWEGRGAIGIDFITKSLTWWGGLKNRKPETKGYYLDIFGQYAKSASKYRLIILTILESMDYQQWEIARKKIDHYKGLEIALTADEALNNKSYCQRLRSIKQRLRSNFGYHWVD